ncbi:MAG: SDR family NAD(P)-dependent oxidoreductase [Bacteroidota bacterium]
MFDLSNKTAVITGGAGEIGKTVAKTFLDNKLEHVMLVDLDEEALRAASDELGDRASYQVADVSKEDDVKAYMQAAKDKMGHVDVFCNNAGIEGPVSPTESYPTEAYDKVIGVNLRGMFLGNKYIIPVMKENGGGSVIMTSSVAGMRGFGNMPAYVSSKFGVTGLMKTLAAEGPQHGIRANSIHPAPVDNRMMRSIEKDFSSQEGQSDDTTAIQDEFKSMIPLGRYAKNEEVANAFLFLASDASSYLNGTQLTVDGGMTAI